VVIMKRIVPAVGVVLVLSLSLAGCSASDAVVPNSHVTVGEVGVISTLNQDVLGSTSNGIASDLAKLTRQSFYEVDAAGDLVANKDFGTVTVTKQSPFTVTYTLGKSAQWSDGSQVDATDMALAVAAAQNKTFKSVGAGTSLATAKIVGTPKPGSSSITLEFASPVFDWKTALQISEPAHIVGKAAGLTGDVASVRAAIVDAISNQNSGVIGKLGAAYSSAFTATSDAGNFLSDGAYAVSSVAADSIALKAQRDFAGSHKAIAEKVSLQIFADNATALTAVTKATVDILSPKATLNEPQSDLVNQAKTLPSKLVTVDAPAGDSSEQFALNLGSGLFSEARYKDIKTAQTVRQAFLELVPKARAYDFASMTQAVSKSDSFIFANGSKNYSAVIGSNGSASYIFQDVEKSKQLISTIKFAKTPTVRVLFDANDPAAVAEWTLLSDHSANSGFNLTNLSGSNIAATLRSGAYDVYLGASPLLGAGAGSLQALTGGGYRMPQQTFATLTAGIATATGSKLDQLLQALDKALFDQAIGLPMYQIPELVIHNKRILNMQVDPYGNNSTWGYWTWHVTADK